MSHAKLAKLADIISVLLSAKRGTDKEGELVILDRSYFRIVLCISAYIGQYNRFQHYIRIESDAIERFVISEGLDDKTWIYSSRPYEADGVTVFSSEFAGDGVDLYMYGNPWKRIKNLSRNGQKSYSCKDCARIMSEFIQKDIAAFERRLDEYKIRILERRNSLKFTLLLCLTSIKKGNSEDFFEYLSKYNDPNIKTCKDFQNFILNDSVVK